MACSYCSSLPNHIYLTHTYTSMNTKLYKYPLMFSMKNITNYNIAQFFTQDKERKMADDCARGKTSWPELVGAKGTDAAVIINRENPFIKAQIISENAITLPVEDCTRVYVRVDDVNGIVTQIPFVG